MSEDITIELENGDTIIIMELDTYYMVSLRDPENKVVDAGKLLKE
jgi:hypothetical protein